jgi:hypothetical protein
MKKGQITMEALLLYGAAILVVLLAVAALIYFGVLDLGVFLPEKCQFTGSGTLVCNDYAVTSGMPGTIQLELMNKGTKGVTISSADFVAADTTAVNTCSLASTTTITPGDQQIITLSCNVGAAPGQKISGKVRLTTVIGGGSLTHNMVGDLTATVG